MFRDSEFHYLALSLVLVVVGNGVAIAYQGLSKGIWLPGPVEIVKWQSNVIAIVLIVLATLEVLKVIANRIINRLNQKDRDEVVRQVREDNKRRFNETIEKFGIRDNDGRIVSMPLTPEVLRFLLVGDDDTG
jgi:hypothetical protein